jgi:hypothetical protein
MRTFPLALATAVLAAGFGVALAGKDEIKPSVKFARTWDDAVAEARMLNVPIVVHSHGFY